MSAVTRGNLARRNAPCAFTRCIEVRELLDLSFSVHEKPLDEAWEEADVQVYMRTVHLLSIEIPIAGDSPLKYFIVHAHRSVVPE
ncbi:hypothetical protein [Bradyrhizobium elkanii]|uniref:hypothetical protein n=1 Tax=Bradyrhizobium elkanii TaxID=29448 RepID=UPI0012FE6B45|nr:hypothetical protein [Bradyrhizobium elkanii]WLA83275.1 hypothetical protein QNJ99_02755 [Bradyrhizobium elkanii]